MGGELQNLYETSFIFIPLSRPDSFQGNSFQCNSAQLEICVYL